MTDLQRAFILGTLWLSRRWWIALCDDLIADELALVGLQPGGDCPIENALLWLVCRLPSGNGHHLEKVWLSIKEEDA